MWKLHTVLIASNFLFVNARSATSALHYSSRVEVLLAPPRLIAMIELQLYVAS